MRQVFFNFILQALQNVSLILKELYFVFKLDPNQKATTRNKEVQLYLTYRALN